MKTISNLIASCLLCLALAISVLPVAALAHPDITTDGDIQFFPQGGSPVSLPNFLSPDAGCNWSGVAGQVFDRQGEPLSGLLVKVEGVVGGSAVSFHVLSGSSLRMGVGGFEIKLADQALSSQGMFTLQLTDVTGAELSPPYSLTTSAACDHNLLVFNLVEAVVTDRVYLPLIRR